MSRLFVTCYGCWVRYVVLSCFLMFALGKGLAQQRSMRVMEYNVENMFDTLHTAGLSDIDFTPTGKIGRAHV